MKPQSRIPAKSSRRSFSSDVLKAFLAMPFLSVLSHGQAKKKPKASQVRIVTHDTPPPITVEDGSLEIYTREEFTLLTSTPPYRYASPFAGTPNLSHIKVLNRKGETIHYERRARGGTLRIELRNDQGTMVDELTISGGAQIQLTSQRLRLGGHSNHKPHAFRKHKFDHPGQGRNFRISRVEILNAPHPFVADAGSHAGYFSEEYRILLWLER